MSIGFTLLGNVTIHSRGVAVTAGSPRQRCVLALLLIDVNRPVSAQTLLTRVWGDDVPPRAMTSLYSYVSRLRALRSDPGDAERWDILRTPAGYVLRTDSSAVDLFRFRSLVERARGATDPREAEASYSQALALWRGEPFAGLRSDWLDAYRLTLAEEHLRARLDHYELLLNRGRHVDLVQPLAALAAEQPLDEQVAHLHMLALYRMGQPAAALTAYEQLRQRLVEQLGVDPGPRLQELHHRILVFDDALAAPAADGVERRTPHQLPASPSGFIGRREALRLLDAPEGRADGAAPDVSVIAGMAGVGKSWLALRWAHQHADEFPDGQLYAQLNGFSPSARPTDPGDVLRLFLMALGATESELPADTEGRAALYRTMMAGRKILVVLDNARDSAQVVPLLPGTPGCRTLVTSRNRLSSLKVRAGADVVGLGVLPAGESARLFARRVGDDRAAEPALRDIVRWCAGLPLALDIAAAHADGLPCASLDQLAQDLRDPSTRLDVLDAGDVSASLRVLFAASHAALDPEPGRVFGLLGLVPHQDVSLDALAHFIERDPTRTRRIMRVLEEACLIRQHRPGRYQMHDLVRLYVEEQATGLTAGQSDRHTRRLVGFYVCTAQAAHRVLEPHRTAQDPPALEVPGAAPLAFDDAQAALAWFDAEHACLQEVVTITEQRGLWLDFCRLTWALHTFRWRRGLFEESIRAWYTALDAAADLNDASLTAHTRQRLGVALAQAGRYDEALPHLDAALERFRADGGLAGLTRTHHSLAEVHVRINAYERALPHFARALEGYRELGDQVGESNTLNGTGWALARLGRYASGEAHCLQALPLLQVHEDGEGQAATWDTLAYIARRTGRTSRAVDACRQALAHFQAIGNANREADTWASLGDMQADAGDGDAARQAWARALDLYRDQGRTVRAREMASRLAARTEH
ncbi:BTAD domain-containing putative transcriptional regulator [Streptomyces sp. SID161]|uniref:AfsR/SARP family transcriptional regulator n=1 Tax=Streptomyces sp. SID161 TaxID=2690251 RepID=UPI001371D3C9|nr:BTAD domain-containing putative transcriptional regulator [Streptomyces sp. SID161]MYW49761.1 tetratricopeptide repeat protein [Streptomyces sp. SID161]